MEIKTRLYIVDSNKEKFMGIGVMWLLKSIEKGESLRQGASELGISYSKAYKMVSTLEKHLKHPVIERQRGGSDRKGSSLTEFGKEFIKLYETFQKGAKREIESQFNSFVEAYEQLEKRFEGEKRE